MIIAPLARVTNETKSRGKLCSKFRLNIGRPNAKDRPERMNVPSVHGIHDANTIEIGNATLGTEIDLIRCARPTNDEPPRLIDVENHFQKEIEKLKTQKSKDVLETKKIEYVREFKKMLPNLQQVTAFQMHLVNAKMGIVKKLNSVKGLTDTFIKTSNGFKVVNPEGYVAIDRVSGDAVKLVDRMEFSFNNFTAIKAWDK